MKSNEGQDESPRSVAREGDFYFNSLKIERARWAVRHTAIYTVKGNRSDGSEPASGIVRGMLGASALSQCKPCNVLLTTNGG
jgi:hypothetical protein